jgi:hypothetical protein
MSETQLLLSLGLTERGAIQFVATLFTLARRFDAQSGFLVTTLHPESQPTVRSTPLCPFRPSQRDIGLLEDGTRIGSVYPWIPGLSDNCRPRSFASFTRLSSEPTVITQHVANSPANILHPHHHCICVLSDPSLVLQHLCSYFCARIGSQPSPWWTAGRSTPLECVSSRVCPIVDNAPWRDSRRVALEDLNAAMPAPIPSLYKRELPNSQESYMSAASSTFSAPRLPSSSSNLSTSTTGDTEVTSPPLSKAPSNQNVPSPGRVRGDDALRVDAVDVQRTGNTAASPVSLDSPTTQGLKRTADGSLKGCGSLVKASAAPSMSHKRNKSIESSGRIGQVRDNPPVQGLDFGDLSCHKSTSMQVPHLAPLHNTILLLSRADVSL